LANLNCGLFKLLNACFESVKTLESRALLHLGVEALVGNFHGAGDTVAENDSAFCCFSAQVIVHKQVLFFLFTTNGKFIQGFRHAFILVSSEVDNLGIAASKFKHFAKVIDCANFLVTGFLVSSFESLFNLELVFQFFRLLAGRDTTLLVNG
jgi:hypothetical protein